MDFHAALKGITKSGTQIVKRTSDYRRDLNTLSIAELEDLLVKEQNIYNDVPLRNKLPDKGNKIKLKIDQIAHILELKKALLTEANHRKRSSDIPSSSPSSNTSPNTTTTSLQSITTSTTLTTTPSQVVQAERTDQQALTLQQVSTPKSTDQILSSNDTNVESLQDMVQLLSIRDSEHSRRDQERKLKAKALVQGKLKSKNANNKDARSIAVLPLTESLALSEKDFSDAIIESLNTIVEKQDTETEEEELEDDEILDE